MTGLGDLESRLDDFLALIVGGRSLRGTIVGMRSRRDARRQKE
jgi:hypothetical protein